MARRKLGVVFLIPGHVAAQIDGLRRALGVTHLERVPPHITLVPPINVAVDEVDAAIALARRVASEEQPLHVVIGPIGTFSPITPVLFLQVGGPGLDAIKALRDALDAGPFAQELTRPFVPHVTISDDANGSEIEGAMASLVHYVEHLTLDAITVLEQHDDDIWRPIADAPLGADTTTRTIGSGPITFAVNAYATRRGTTMGRYQPLAVEAFSDGHTVGVARGHVARDDVAWLDELVVIRETRGTGIGAGLAREFVAAARATGATQVRATRGATIAGFLVKFGFTIDPADEFVLDLSL